MTRRRRKPSIRSRDFTSRGRWFDQGFTKGELTTVAWHRPGDRNNKVIITYGGTATLYLTYREAVDLANNIVDAVDDATNKTQEAR